MSVLDLILALLHNRTLIVRSILAFTLLSGAYAILASDTYTSSAQAIRESQEESPGLGNLGGIGALSGLGVRLGGASSGLSVDAFSQVLNSREVRLAVIRDTFPFPDTREPMTFLEHGKQKAGGILSRVLDGIAGTSGESFRNGEEATASLSAEEARAIDAVGDMVNTTVDQETGLMTITVTAGGARLAEGLTRSFVNHLTTRVRELRTEKAREQLRFLETRFNEVQRELSVAEENLADFLERNQNPTTATLQFQEDRLRRQVSFKEQLYSDLQSQLTQARIDVQRQQPVVTVVEKPVAPRKPTGPPRLIIAIMGVVMGGTVGIGIAIVREFIQANEDGGRKQTKLREIRELARDIHWTEIIGRRTADGNDGD